MPSDIDDLKRRAQGVGYRPEVDMNDHGVFFTLRLFKADGIYATCYTPQMAEDIIVAEERRQGCCERCKGRGFISAGSFKYCEHNGTGHTDELGSMYKHCLKCSGTGKRIKEAADG